MESFLTDKKADRNSEGGNKMESFVSRRYGVEKIYPTTKLLFALVLCAATFLLPFKGAGYYIFLINIGLAVMSNKFKSYVALAGKTLVPIIMLMFIFQLFVVSGTHELFGFGPFRATQESLTSAILFSSNIAGIASSIMLFFQLTPTRSLIKAMENANIPKTAIFVINSTLLLVPEASKLSKTIMEAQQSRGVETEGSLLMRIKSFVPMISPLVLSTISNNEEKVLTLESRGFSCSNKRTVLFPLKKNKRDRLLNWTSVFIFVGLIIWRVLLWK